MSLTLDSTHALTLKSWVTSANEEGCDFPIQNLPYGRFRSIGSQDSLTVGIAIGRQILDLKLAADAPGWSQDVQVPLKVLATGDLNAFMAMGPTVHRSFRVGLSIALREGSSQQQALSRCLHEQSQVSMAVPCHIGDYTDFYTSIHHATTVGKQFRPDNPLLPNYQWIPIGYHGRASSIRASGTDFHRPRGQIKRPNSAEPILEPSEKLDYELELGWFVGKGNDFGCSIPLGEADQHIFGAVLFNDWSARDIQSWEYQPLGPFLSKNFASTVSPWIVTLDGLAPYRVPFTRLTSEPQPLPYLDSQVNREQGAFSITLEAWICTAKMKDEGIPAVRLSKSNTQRSTYWSPAQLVAHHTVNGCNLQAGDLLGSGTLSGPDAGEAGSLLEISEGGKRPLKLPSGEQRYFLADGDTLTLRGYCERDGYARIGFGEASATVLTTKAPF